MRIGFIGLGNMASAMIGGMLDTGLFKLGEIIGSARTQETLLLPLPEYLAYNGLDAIFYQILVLSKKWIFLQQSKSLAYFHLQYL